MESIPMICPACGSGCIQQYRQLKDVRIDGANLSLARCGRCRLVFTSPQASAAQLARIYGDDGYYAYQPLDIGPVSRRTGPVGKIRDWAKRSVLDHYYGYGAARPHFAPIRWRCRLGALLKCWPREDFFMKRRIVPYCRSGKHLDIGCGSGDYVRWMKEHGWRSEGIEINAMAVRNARLHGLDVRQTPLLESRYPPDQFDLVTAWGVIEHLPAISDCLSEIARIMKPGGLFAGFVPNIDSWEASIFGQRWQGLELPSHLYHFSPGTLARYLAQAGLKMRRIEFLPTMDSWKASLNGVGIRTGCVKTGAIAVGWLATIIANRVRRGAMFRFDAYKER
jgi:SAM-dependent methyltransferase